MSDEPIPHKHCWHRSPVQHTHLKMHADVRCCHCGEDKCVPLEHRVPDGHGPHTPIADMRMMPKRDPRAEESKPVVGRVTATEAAEIPVAVVADVVTLGGVANDRDEGSYTLEALERLKRTRRA